MALKPTIYKCRIDLSDLNQNYYDTLSLTIAQHPSETLERMMVRMLAYCINAQQKPVFSKGLSTPDEPDLWAHSMDGNLLLWIDVGEPATDRIKKASRITKNVMVYSFNTKSDTWWSQNKNEFLKTGARFFQFQWTEIKTLAGLVERTMVMSITISGDSAYIATAGGECEINWVTLINC